MIDINIYESQTCKTVSFGRKGENLARRIMFDMSALIAEFGAGSFEWVIRRPHESTVYIAVNKEQDGSTAILNLTATETAISGYGGLELRYYVDDVIVKTIVWRTSIAASLGGGDVPDPIEDYIDQMREIAQEASESADAAGDSATQAAVSAANAAGSATEAAGYAANAAASASASAGSATDSAASATAAHTSETNAANSATAAAGSATNAANSASAASGSASQAASSVTQAAGSASAAANSAIQAAQSATAAAQSATAAASSAQDIAAAATQIQTNKDDITELKNQITNTAISNNNTINSAIKELYIDNADLSSADSLSVNRSTGGYQFVFRDGATVVLTLVFTLTGDVRIGYDMANSVLGLAVFSEDFDSLMLSGSLSAKFNSEKITVLSANPFISKYVLQGNACYIPVFTRTTSKRISTSGTIVDASSSWFYSSPIPVKVGDIIRFRCGGNSSAAPLSLTDASGSYHTPCIVYSGTDPDDYTYVCDKNGYICWSITTGFENYLYIASAETNGKYTLANYGTQNEGKVLAIDPSGAVTPTTLNIPSGGDEGLPIEAIDYSVRRPTVVASVDVTNLSGWTTNGTTLSLARKYNNITKTNRQCVSVTSESGNGLAYFNLDSAVDATQKALLFEISIGEYSNTNPPVGNVAIELFSGSGRTSTYKASFIVQGNTGDSSYNPVYNHNGWFVACLFFPSLEGTLVTIGSGFDPTNVTAIGVHPYNTTGVANTVHIAKMAFVDAMQKPGIVTIIDNFGVSVPAMADYAYSKGVRLNLSIIPGFYAGASGAPICASKAELDRVAQQGHCIWNHTWTHAILNYLTYPQIHDQVNLAETWMQINGYGDFKEFISNPSARLNTEACNALLDTNAAMIFHKWVGAPRCVYIPYYPTLRCLQTTVLDQEVSGTMTGTGIGTVAQKAMTYGGITVVGFHGTYWELDDGVSWKAYIDKIASVENVYHYGLDEIYNGQWC